MSDEKTLRAFCKNLFSAVDCLHDRQSLILHDALAKLTLNQLRMLKTIYLLTEECGSGVTLKRIAEALEITPAAASEMVNALVSKNVLARVTKEQDRRSVDIRLAPELLEKIHRSECEYAAAAADFLEQLPEKERLALQLNIAAFARFMEQKEKP